MSFIRNNFKTVIFGLILVGLTNMAFTCTKSKAKCKADAKKAKKNKVGWQK